MSDDNSSLALRGGSNAVGLGRGLPHRRAGIIDAIRGPGRPRKTRRERPKCSFRFRSFPKRDTPLRSPQLNNRSDLSQETITRLSRRSLSARTR